jgi:hypothetical protein
MGFEGPFLVLEAGARTLLDVPMLKDGELLGGILIFRQEVRPFTDKQIALVTSFAAQAVIAIENARLLNELRQRTADLTESLEQQIATADVLRVIASSPSDIAPVLEVIVRTARELCGAEYAILWRLRSDGKYDMEWSRVHDAGSGPHRTATLDARGAAAAQRCPDRCYRLARTEMKPFTQKQIELVTSYADQAVIAIENARLLNELRQRSDLSESLEQQTATSEVLQVISSSHGHFEPVRPHLRRNVWQHIPLGR